MQQCKWLVFEHWDLPELLWPTGQHVKGVEAEVEVIPFGIEQVPDLLVVDLHVGNLNREALLLPLFLLGPVKQSTAQARNQTGLVA